MLLPTYNSRMINAATPRNPAGPAAAAALTPSLTRSSACAPLFCSIAAVTPHLATTPPKRKAVAARL
ncbi:unnamed protein product [Sphagnum jensenii]|uniref:Uncharacterized protein n=1 Tax=Sphagnum jensenii TaxID=128206 RepID=A0ABP1B4G2_9BRYO